MHQHLFGSSFFARAFNHFSTIVGRSVIDRLEDDTLKGWGLLSHLVKFGKVFMKNFVSYTTEKLKLRGYNSEFHVNVKK